MPCTSKQQKIGSGVYGEIEPCAGSTGELNLSISPATTKRRMTRERSVPASSSRSASSSSKVITQTDVDEDTGRLSLTSTVCRTRAMSSRENNTTDTISSTTTIKSQDIPSVCIQSPDSQATTSTANSSQQIPHSSLPSTSRQIQPCTSTATGINAPKMNETASNIPSDPTTAILHDVSYFKCHSF